VGRRGDELLALLEHAERVELCLFDGHRETRIELHDVTAHNWHATSRASCPPTVRLVASTAPRTGVRGPLQPEQAPSTWREGDRGADRVTGPTSSRTCRARPRSRPRARRRGRCRRDPQVRGGRQLLDWEDDRLPETAWTDTVIYDAREGVHPAAPFIPGRSARHLRGPRLEPARVLREPRHRGRAAADPPHRRRRLPTAGSNYWGYSSIVTSRRTRSMRLRTARCCPVPGMVKALHGQASRRSSTSSTTTRRRGTTRADALLPRPRQRATTAHAGRPASTWTSRGPATRSTPCTVGCG
jgi:hypothetical protein